MLLNLGVFCYNWLTTATTHFSAGYYANLGCVLFLWGVHFGTSAAEEKTADAVRTAVTVTIDSVFETLSKHVAPADLFEINRTPANDRPASPNLSG